MSIYKKSKSGLKKPHEASRALCSHAPVLVRLMSPENMNWEIKRKAERSMFGYFHGLLRILSEHSWEIEGHDDTLRHLYRLQRVAEQIRDRTTVDDKAHLPAKHLANDVKELARVYHCMYVRRVHPGSDFMGASNDSY